MHDVIRRTQPVTIRRYATKPVAPPAKGFTTDFDNYTDQVVDVELEIDLTELFRTLGVKAARSVGGRSVEAGGLVVAKRKAVR